MGRSNPRRPQARRSAVETSALLRRATTGISGNGMAKGWKTCRFGATGTHPDRPRRSLWSSLARSLRLAPGRRFPIEFTQSTGFWRDKMRMMWVLLVGSVPQSLLKQIIGIFSSMLSGGRRTRDLHGIFGVQEGPLPDLEVYEDPQSAAVIQDAVLMQYRCQQYDGGLVQPPRERLTAKHVLDHPRQVLPSHPPTHH